MTAAERADAEKASDPWVEQRVIVPNPQGFHVRPAQQVASVASQFDSDVVLRLGDQDVNAKSTVHLMVLSAVQGTPFLVRARGKDAEVAVAAVAALFAKGFDEMDGEEST
ncbi:MAG: HPr family phosphocarrier protein [Planctomycetota bacterium]